MPTHKTATTASLFSLDSLNNSPLNNTPHHYYDRHSFSDHHHLSHAQYSPTSPNPSFSPTGTGAPVKVMISGAGLGGLTLGILLEKAGIEYEIYEQADRFVRIGSAMALTATVLPLFDQLGVLDQVMAKSKPVEGVQGYNEKMKLFLPINYQCTEKYAGYLTRMITHPDLYDILYSLIPQDRILWGKKIAHVHHQHDRAPTFSSVSSTTSSTHSSSPRGMQSGGGVTIECTDGTTYKGQILVGADGAHSGVRESLYKELDNRGELPKSDKEGLSFNGVCLLGETKPLRVEKFPRLKDPTASFQAVHGEKKPYFWTTVTTANNTICWFVIQFYDKNTIQTTESIRRWKSQPAGEMCEEIKDLPIPCGENLTLHDLMEETSRSLLSKVLHEEKLFLTWYSGRTVLIGDACHKMSPAAGLGAVSAFHDAIVLANYLHALPMGTSAQWSQSEITKAFKGYKEERFPFAKHACEYSHSIGQLMGKHWSNELSRVVAGKTPDWMWKMGMRKVVANRPQVAFLPLVPVKGTVKPSPQPSLHLDRSPQNSVECL